MPCAAPRGGCRLHPTQPLGAFAHQALVHHLHLLLVLLIVILVLLIEQRHLEHRTQAGGARAGHSGLQTSWHQRGTGRAAADSHSQRRVGDTGGTAPPQSRGPGPGTGDQWAPRVDRGCGEGPAGPSHQLLLQVAPLDDQDGFGREAQGEARGIVWSGPRPHRSPRGGGSRWAVAAGDPPGRGARGRDSRTAWRGLGLNACGGRRLRGARTQAGAAAARRPLQGGGGPGTGEQHLGRPLLLLPGDGGRRRGRGRRTGPPGELARGGARRGPGGRRRRRRRHRLE